MDWGLSDAFAGAEAPIRRNQPEYRLLSPISSQFKGQIYTYGVATLGLFQFGNH